MIDDYAKLMFGSVIAALLAGVSGLIAVFGG